MHQRKCRVEECRRVNMKIVEARRASATVHMTSVVWPQTRLVADREGPPDSSEIPERAGGHRG